jgi:hypothetical protein
VLGNGTHCYRGACSCESNGNDVTIWRPNGSKVSTIRAPPLPQLNAEPWRPAVTSQTSCPITWGLSEACTTQQLSVAVKFLAVFGRTIKSVTILRRYSSKAIIVRYTNCKIGKTNIDGNYRTVRRKHYITDVSYSPFDPKKVTAFYMKNARSFVTYNITRFQGTLESLLLRQSAAPTPFIYIHIYTYTYIKRG